MCVVGMPSGQSTYSGTMEEDILVVRPSMWNLKLRLLFEKNDYIIHDVTLVEKRLENLPGKEGILSDHSQSVS